MNESAIVSEFDGLTHEEKGSLLDLLWERYQREEAKRGLTTAESEELKTRLREYRADPSSARPVAEVHRELRASLLDE